MYQILIIVLILICLIIFGFVNFSKKSKNGGLEKFKTYTTEKYEFEYPLDWSVKAIENKTFTQLNLKQNSAREGEIGKWLEIKIYSGSEFPQVKSYSRDMISGQLVIAGKEYDRVDLGSGLSLYYVVVKESGLVFEFGYNSNSTENSSSDVVEAIIQSLILNPKTITPLSDENEMISKAIQQKLLNSNEDYFVIEDISAQKMKTEFFSNSIIWLIFKHPDLLNRPLFAIGKQNEKLFILSNLEESVLFYNNNLKTLKEGDYIKLATELLQVSYFEEEFGYANNTSKGRGYNVISNPREIIGLANRAEKFGIKSPKTTKQGDKYVTEVWFWGAHNCELHKFNLIAGKSKIEDYKDEIVGKLGKCQPLSYE